MFSHFPRLSRDTSQPVPPLPVAPLRFAADMVARLLAHRLQNGSFIGALPDELPRQITEDGIEVACQPDHLVGITAARPAFGVEVAGQPAAALMSALPLRADWVEISDRAPTFRARIMGPVSTLDLTCLSCGVDPCFNGRAQPGARLIVHARA